MERIAATVQEGFSGEVAVKLEEVHLSCRAGTAAAICSIIRAILNCAFVKVRYLVPHYRIFVEALILNFVTEAWEGW